MTDKSAEGTPEEAAKKESEAKEMIRKIYEMHQDLERQLDFVEKNLHFIPQQLKDIAAAPEKLIKDYDKIVEKFERELDEKMLAALGSSTFSIAKRKMREKKAQKKGRKGQFLGARKKWIPMR